MGKARTDLYSTKGDALTRTHKPCPKCGPGIFLAEHADRRSCGRCGYSESKPAPTSAPTPAPKPKAAKPPAAKPAAPAAPKPAAPAAPKSSAPAP